MSFREKSTRLRALAWAIGGLGARRPVPTLLVVLGITAALGWPAAHIGYSDDILHFLPEEHPEVKAFRDIGDRFGGLSVAVIGIEAADGDLFTPGRLDALRRVTRAVGEVPGVSFSTGLTELRDITVGREDGEDVAVVSELVGELPDPQDLPAYAALKQRVLARDHLLGVMVSRDAAACLVLANLATDANHKEAADRLRARVEGLLTEADVGLSAYFGGVPFVGSYVASVAKADIAMLTPWVSAAIIGIVLLTARSVLGAGVALLSVGLAIVWVLGMLSLLGRPLTLVSSSLPMLLVALGSAYSIHLLAKVLANLDAGAERADAVRNAVEDVGPPVLVAGLTTALGFVSFLVMDIAPMREFGLWMAIATLVVVVLGVAVVPAACALLPLKGRPGGRTPAWALRAMLEAARLVARRPLVSVPVLALTAFFAATWTTLLPGAMNMRAFFAEESEPVRSEDFLEARFGGSAFLQIEAAGDLKDPLVLRQVERLADLALAHPGVTDVQSVVIPVVLAAEGLVGEARVPHDIKATRAISALVADDPNIRLLVDDAWSRALVTVKLSAVGGREALELAEKLRAVKLGGPRQKVPRAALREGQRFAERAEVLAHLRTVVGVDEALGPGLSGALSATAELSAAAVEARLRSDIEDDELVFLKDGADLGALAGRIAPRVQALTVDDLYREIAAIADPEELEQPRGLRKAVEHIHRHLAALAAAAVTDARVADVLKVVPDADAARVRRVVSVLADPYASLPGGEAHAARFTVSGYPLVYEGMNKSVQRNQTRSLLVSLVLVVLTLGLFFGSLRVGLVASIPATLTLLVMFAVMGVLRIPMNVGTSMIASIAMGVGIDYAVHLVWRHGVPAPEEADAALTDSLTATGWGIVINALEVTVGFGLLVFGTLVPTQNVGLLTAVAMTVSAASTLVLVPALVQWVAPRRNDTA